ncbi:HEAT repeat domain-containing protein [Okeania sp. SIO1I7]|uniref:HEAT repeat domain-containing protein n=1 Tax=Okeania sp. SIO1I7 TaxID=2607772 RepID=UPI0013F8A82E|nr:HEAT repeat domain-containing protein [Okeania sp. SIO1I7]NET24032.1 hypothetical protein [Okeania sp. SIO1I7]
MEPITIVMALAAVLGTKALEKTGENIGQVVWDKSAKLMKYLKQESPDTVTAIEQISEQPLDYCQAILEMLGAATNPDVAQTMEELAAATKANPHPKINEVLEEIEKILNFQQQTKAELYGQFVERFYRWKSDRFPIEKSKRRELNLALGRLAKENIDSSGDRSPLRKDFIEKILGNADDENSLFYLALQIGWLNNVGVVVESPTEKVYAFFHATFEEYFAAVAIDDWDFFLPRAHKNKPVKGKRYRIFEPQWKQVILLWLGREDIKKEEKEGFILALTNFKDGCRNFLTRTIVDRGFYENQAYFLAADGIAEFRKCSQSDQIVKKVVDWGNNEIKTETHAVLLWNQNVNKYLWRKLSKPYPTFDPALFRNPNEYWNEYWIDHDLTLLRSVPDSIRLLIAEKLGKVDIGNEKAINGLVQLLESTDSNNIRRQAASSLGQIGTGNENAINALVQLLGSTSDDQTRMQAVSSLGQIDPGNEYVINALVQLLESTSNDQTRMQAASSLGQIDPGNEYAINALVQLLESTSNDQTRMQAASSLGQIDPGNEYAINALVQLLGSISHDTRRQAASSLGQIGTGNENAINALVQLLGSISNDQTRWQLEKIGVGNLIATNTGAWMDGLSNNYIMRRQVAESLEKIGTGNENAIDGLVQLLGSTSDDQTRWQAAATLGKIGMGNQKAIDGLLQLLGSNANNTRWQAAATLKKIGTGNENAINVLVQLLGSNADYSTRREAAATLGKIDPGNQKAIDGLVDLLGSNADNTRWQAAATLGEILAEEQMAKVVTSLKDYLSVINWLIKSHLFEKCYEIIWNCAQTLPYPEFYQAWHSPSKSKKPRWLF